ncbi:MAG: gluconate 2-dehydrogenase subunit 3 family protein [Roseimicrobium sp.]
MRDDLYVLGHAAVSLARRNEDARHRYGEGHYAEGDARGRVRDAWKFPIVDTCADAPAGQAAADFNDVTFIYPSFEVAPASVAVVGTFGNIYEKVPLRQVEFAEENLPYWAVTLTVPRREIFYYKYIVDEVAFIDPVNPQRVVMDNGQEWSRFFTWECSQPVTLEAPEMAILQRLCNHLLPFRTREGQRFLSWYYAGLDDGAKSGLQRRAYRLDDSAGAAFYIDHILAREENHHLVDYRICLRQLRRILGQRAPQQDPADVAKELYANLYNELAADNVPGWDRSEYGRPRYFLDLLRRHAFTGAFSHPKYGGNSAAAGWAYLATETADGGASLFDWRQSLERPLGTNNTYLG